MLDEAWPVASATRQPTAVLSPSERKIGEWIWLWLMAHAQYASVAANGTNATAAIGGSGSQRGIDSAVTADSRNSTLRRSARWRIKAPPPSLSDDIGSPSSNCRACYRACTFGQKNGHKAV